MKNLDQRLPLRVSKRDLELIDALGKILLKSDERTQYEKDALKTLDGKVSRSAVVRWCIQYLSEKGGVQVYEKGRGLVPYKREIDVRT